MCDWQVERNCYYLKSIAGMVQFLAEKELALREIGMMKLRQVYFSVCSRLECILAYIPDWSIYYILSIFSGTTDCCSRLFLTFHSMQSTPPPEIQNEIIATMADTGLKEIISEISSANSFSLKRGETRDSFGIENVSVAFRSVFEIL